MGLGNISESDKRKAIVESLDKNIFVEAGAGAGKTRIIVTRILHQLMAGVRPAQIVAITFTNAATRELKGRILLEAEVIASSTDGTYTAEQKETVKSALDELDQMQISTIHSFCYRLLSEKMFEARLPFDITVADESETEKLFDRHFKLWAETLKREDWERLLPVGKYRGGVIDRLRNVTKQLMAVPPEYEIKTALPELDDNETVIKLEPILNRLCGDAVSLVNEAYKRNYSEFTDVSDDELTAYGRELKVAVSDGSLNPLFKVLRKNVTTNSFIVKTVTEAVMKKNGMSDKAARDAFKESAIQKDGNIRSYLASVRSNIETIEAQYANSLYDPYVEYAKKARDHIRKMTDTGLLSNDRLLLKTRDFISASEEARAFFRDKFKTIYVDEFQDTDSLQESFLWMLASDPDDPAKLRDGALFVVGDPKQSIYRFRGAEPEIYFMVKDKMVKLDNALVAELSDNHRSNDRVINWVNGHFATRPITPGHGYIAMRAVNPLPASGLPDKLIAGVYKYRSPEDALDREQIAEDRKALCRLIRSLTGGGYLIADRTSDGRVYYREIRYSDFLILCMNTPGMTEYAGELNKNGIPVAMDSKRDVSADHDLTAFIRLYAFLADPYNIAARVGAMEVLAYSGLDDRGENERILERMTEETRNMSAYGCIRYLLARPELILDKDCELTDHYIQDMQKKIIQMTEQTKASLHCDKNAAMEAMSDYLQTRLEHELIPDRDIDAVRFMNLHKAKGLEGNIVIWTNRTDCRFFRPGAYRDGTTFYPSVAGSINNRMTNEWSAYGGDSSLIDNARKEEESEAIRLEYVAATRAKQALIFMDRYNKYPGNMFSEGYDLNGLESVEQYMPDPESVDPDGNGTNIPASAPALQIREVTEEEKRQRAALGEPVFSSESPSDYEDDSVGKMYVADKTEIADDGRKNKPQNVIVRPTGNIFGTVMHRAFELVIDRWNCDPGLLGIDSSALVPSCIRQAVNESLDDIKDDEVKKFETFLNEAVMAFGRWYFGSDIKKNADKVYTELPFSYVRTDSETPVWMHGEADLVVRLKDGGIWILDYKSDTDAHYPTEEAFEERLRGKYTPQINAYKAAVGRVFGVPEEKISAALVSFSQKELKKGEKLRVRVTGICG